MRDIETIDAMSSIKFRDKTANNCWNTLIDTEYFKSATAKTTMDFARRWAKTMQHMMQVEKKAFEDVILPASREANLNNASPSEKSLALELLIAVWFMGDKLQTWAKSFDKKTLFLKLAA